MIDLVDLVWIVPFFPLVAAVVNGVASSGFGLSRRVVDAVALTGSGLAFLIGLYLVVRGGWPILAIGLTSLLAGFACGAGSKPVNILVLYADDWRHDTLSAAGNPVVKTPELDRLAGEGIRSLLKSDANRW